MQLLVTRPQPDADELAQALRGLGHEVIVEPLLEFEPHDLGSLSFGDAQAIIVTSRNALRALDALGRVHEATHLPLYTVGGASARMGEQLGFEIIHIGSGTAQGLLPLIMQGCRADAGLLVHLAGEKLAFDMRGALEQHGFNASQPVLYHMRPIDKLSTKTESSLRSGVIDGVILMSPLTARTYARLVQDQIPSGVTNGIIHFCLSEKVAEALPESEGKRIAVANESTQDDLLALITREAANY